MSLSASQKQEIKELRSHAAHTFRPTVSALEAILFEPLQVLDHGFVRVVDYMGNDAAIVQAARVSYGAGTKQISEDRGLIHYLMRHWHTTPFEMCEIKLHVKLPIFIARQWLRHRTANVNEYSGRYSIMDREFYVPDVDTLAPQSALNKQGRDANTLSASESAQVLEILKNDSSTCYQHYMEMLNIDEETQQVIDPSRCGLTRELARMNLTLNYYTQFYWKIDLHNMMHFLRLRADDHAQFEIRAYAKVMLDIMQKWTPLTYEAFLDYRLNAVNLSSKALELIKRKLTGQAIAPEDVGMSKREWRELKDLFGDAL